MVAKKNKQQKQQTAPLVSISLVGLDSLPEQFVIESSQPIRLEFSSKNIGKAIQETEQTSEKVIENNVDTQLMSEPMVEAVDPIEPVEIPVAEPTIADTVTALAEPTIPPITDTQQADRQDKQDPVVVLDEEALQLRNSLPKALGEENFTACHSYFDPLTDQQQKDVLTVFFQQLKAGTIKNKVNYFIGLAKKSQQGCLTVPNKHIAKNSPPQYSPEAFEFAKAADEEREERATLWSDYEWLKQQSIAQNKTKQELASDMGMEEAYTLFSPMEQASACAA